MSASPSSWRAPGDDGRDGDRADRRERGAEGVGGEAGERREPPDGQPDEREHRRRAIEPAPLPPPESRHREAGQEGVGDRQPVDHRGARHLVEGGHAGERGGGGAHQRQGQQGAGALAEAHLELEEGAQAQGLEGHRGPGLRRAVGRDQVAARGGRQRDRDEGRGDRADAVEDDRAPRAGPAEDQPREGGVLEAADGREGPQRVVRAGAVQRHGPPDKLRLARDVLGASAGAGARHRGRIGARHAGHQPRGRRGVPDAHVAAQQDVGPLGRARRRPRAGQDRRLGLGARHRGGAADVAGAGAHPLPVEPGVGRGLAGHADVEHADVATRDRREGARGGAPGADRLDHGRRDLGRPGGRAARDDAVVAGADDQRGPGRRPRVGAPRDAGEDDADLLEPPQAPGGLGERVPSPARGLGGALVDRDDRRPGARRGRGGPFREGGRSASRARGVGRVAGGAARP